MNQRNGRYAHGYLECVLRAQRWRNLNNSGSYLVDNLSPGMNVLDVGCGPGSLTIDIARKVDPGIVLGLDRAPKVLKHARKAALDADVHNVEFAAGDVYNLSHLTSCREQKFDVVHAHQVLMHLSDPVTALREMVRACRPGGVVAVRDGDLGSAVWWPQDEHLDDWLSLVCNTMSAGGSDPYAGRKLQGWARKVVATRVAASASVWCFSEEGERDWWAAMWADRTTVPPISEIAIKNGYATVLKLLNIAAAWRTWASSPDAWFALTHGEVIIEV